MIWRRSWVIAEAVTATTRIARVAGSARSRFRASIPVIPGSWMSMRIRAGCCSAAMRRPSSAFSASTTRYPVAWSTSRTSIRLLSLSSTTRISSPRMGARGKRERERRSDTHFALHPQAAAVQLDELSRQREAETGALALARSVAHLAELLEDRLLVRWRDADPGIGDGHLDGAVRVQRPHVDPAALGRELHGVGQQIQEHLLELALVGDDVLDRLVDCQVEREPVAHAPFAYQRERVLEGHAEIERPELQLHPSRLDLGEVEDIVDQREQVAPGAQDDAHVLSLFLVQFAKHAVVQYLREADDPVEGRAELVGHVGEELGLVAAGRLQ